jgi:predicted Zn-ribbon and HTH transcriptional regulator
MSNTESRKEWKLPLHLCYCPDCNSLYDKVLIPLHCYICKSENILYTEAV